MKMRVGVARTLNATVALEVRVSELLHVITHLLSAQRFKCFTCSYKVVEKKS